MADPDDSILDERVFLTPSSPISLRGTPLARQGYVPDLEPFLTTSDLGRSLLDRFDRSSIPRSKSSPQCSPVIGRLESSSKSIWPVGDHHSMRAGVCIVAAPPPAPLPIKFHEMWGTVCSMCSATLGAGALSLPYAFASTGMVGGVVLLMITAAASHYSIVLLSSAIARTGARSYEELTVSLFGKGMGALVELNIIIFCFGGVVAYQVAVADLVHPLTAAWLSRNAVMIASWAVVMLPLSLAERLSALRCASAFGVLAVIYLVLSVVAHAGLCAHWELSPAALEPFAASRTAEPPGSGGVMLWTFRTQSFEALAVMMFAFTCQVNVPNLYLELESRSLPRMRVVSARAVTVCLICYAAVGVAGYADAPDSTSGNLLNNYCVDPGEQKLPRLMLPAYVAMAMSVLMAYPLNILPCRYTLDVMFFQQWGAKRNTVRHCMWTFALTGAGLAVALYVPSINIVFQLMGSTSSAFVCFVLPAAFGLRLRLPEARGLGGKVACAALLVGGAAVGAIATAVTVMGLLTSDGSSEERPAPHSLVCRRQCHF